MAMLSSPKSNGSPNKFKTLFSNQKEEQKLNNLEINQDQLMFGENSSRAKKEELKKPASNTSRAQRNQKSIFKQKMTANFGKGTSDEVVVLEPVSANNVPKKD